MGSGLFKDDQWDTVTGRLTTPQHAVYLFALWTLFVASMPAGAAGDSHALVDVPAESCCMIDLCCPLATPGDGAHGQLHTCLQQQTLVAAFLLALALPPWRPLSLGLQNGAALSPLLTVHIYMYSTLLGWIRCYIGPSTAPPSSQRVKKNNV